MKSIRIWFKKTDTAKYISHLDLSRCMERAIHKAKLPFWYTEGFNPHVFLTITMPISLGYTGLKESMDVKLLQDDMPSDEIIEKLNSGLPLNVRAYNITEPLMKPGAIAFSEYIITIKTLQADKLKEQFIELLSKNSLLVDKKTKKGLTKIDIKEDFANAVFDITSHDTLKINVILKSSNNGSINPKLLFDAFENEYQMKLYPDVVRVNCYDENMKEYQ